MEDQLKDLNEAQRAAVEHKDGPLLIVAGAGTGKTTVLTRRYAHLLGRPGGSPVRTENLLALTFTEKAAGEMEDRVLKLLPNGTYDFWISTFHGFCQRVLEAHALEIGLPNQFRLLNETDAWLLLKRRFNELPLDHYRPLGNPIKHLKALVKHISRAKSEGVTPESYLAFAQNSALDGDSDPSTALGTGIVDAERKRLQELADIYFAYRRMLREEGAMDFGDLILETLRLFQERPSVLEMYRRQFQYVMVDEFQDTDWVQYELIKLLAGSRRNLTVVGDDDQAVYKFRGASLANILQFRDDFPDAKTVALTRNYRSRAEILDAAYGFIKKNNPNRLEVKLKDTGLSKELQAERGASGSVETVWERSVYDEADAVAEKILSLKKIGDPSTELRAGTPWNDFAILVRSNDSAEPFIAAFQQKNIPFQFLALRGLYAKPVVLDVIALLSLLDGVYESSSVWRVVNAACYPFPQKDVAELLHYAKRKGLTLWGAIKQAREAHLSDDGTRQADKLVTHIESLAEAARRERPLKVLQLALDKSGYLATVLRLPEREKREALQHLNGFADRLKRYERSTHGPSLRGFLDEFRLELESGEEGALDYDADAGPDMVKILTVHAAKGLEFKHVFVVSLVDQRFPTRPRSDAIPLPDGLVQERLPEGDVHLEEERRLFYVAMTRAKDTLTLSGATQYGGTRAKKPSVFFEEASVPITNTSVVHDEAARLVLPEQADWQERPVLYYDLKRRFSFTQLAAFHKCPLQYKFAHVYRIPVLGSFQKSFGQSIHHAFEHILDLHLARGQAEQTSLFDVGAGFKPALPAPDRSDRRAGLKPAPTTPFRVTEDEALAIFEQDWIDEWYENRAQHDEHKTKGRQAVRHFVAACHASPPDVLEVEKDFTLILGQHSIKGKIDRVDRLPDGRVAVFDYKTGQAHDKLDAEDKEQLYLYQIALEEKGIKVASLAFIYALDWAVKEVEPLEGEARDRFIEKITTRMDDILKSDFDPTPDPFTCKFCDFKNICEFKKV